MDGISRSRGWDKEIPHGVLPIEQLVLSDKWARKYGHNVTSQRVVRTSTKKQLDRMCPTACRGGRYQHIATCNFPGRPDRLATSGYAHSLHEYSSLITCILASNGKLLCHLSSQ